MISIHDLKYAFRLLSKKPRFTSLTIFVMVLGLGLSIYLFSFFNVMVFKDLPFKDGNSLVQISASPAGQQNGDALSITDYREIKSSLKGLVEFGAYQAREFNVAGRDGARRYSGVAADHNIFELTRTQPALGQGFGLNENRHGGERVVVIGHDLWKTQFAGDPQIIDKVLRIDGESHRVIGVMPKGFAFPRNSDVWVPLQEDTQSDNRANAVKVIGLAHVDGSRSLEEINGELALIMQRIAQQYPDTNKDLSAYVSSIPLAGEGESIAIIYSAHVIAILVLILASVNVGNLLLSRAIERSKETAIRVALGAPRSRLIAQMLWESVIICVSGGVIGLIVLSWGLGVTANTVAQLFVDKPPFWWDFGLDGFTIVLFIAFLNGTILLTGLLPAIKNSNMDFNAVLRDGSRGALGKKAGRLNKFLITSEIFVSLTVLITATVMMVGNYKATHADYGGRTGNTLVANFLLTSSTYTDSARKIQFTQSLQSNLANVSGVEAVMISSALPGASAPITSVAVEGMEYAGEGENAMPKVNYVVTAEETLTNLDVALKSGRYFDSSDNASDKSTVIVTESFASRYFANQSAIGKRIRIADAKNEAQQWLTIVGVVEHTIQGASFGESSRRPTVFRPYAQDPKSHMTVAVRSKMTTPELTAKLREVIRAIDNDVPVYRVETYEDTIGRHTNGMKFITTVFALFGIAAVFLAATGIYGVISNLISQKTQEIGVKRALGADESRITKEYLRMGISHLLWGGIPGLLIGGGMGLAMSPMLGVGGIDLIVVITLLTSIISAAVLLATYFPTRSVLAKEPIFALRYE